MILMRIITIIITLTSLITVHHTMVITARHITEITVLNIITADKGLYLHIMQ